MRQPDLSIIIPAKNEAQRIGKTLDELSRYLRQHKLGEVEVLVVVAGHDNTVEIAMSKRSQFQSLQIVRRQTAGKGLGVKTGMLRARGKYRLFMDADLATPLHHIQTLQKHIKGGADVIIGVRNLTSSHKGIRKFISTFFNLLSRLMLGLNIKDTQCGFKAFRAEAAEDIFKALTIKAWLFDMEALAIAKQYDYSIAQIPIPDWRDVAGGTFGNMPITQGFSTIRDLIKIRWNLVRGSYKKIKTNQS